MKVAIKSGAVRGRLLTLTLFAGIMGACGGLAAQPAGGRGAPPAPSTEALAACKSLASGDACSFTSQQGTEQGTCWAPEGKPLACKPKNAPMGGSQAPKQ